MQQTARAPRTLGKALPALGLAALAALGLAARPAAAQQILYVTNNNDSTIKKVSAGGTVTPFATEASTAGPEGLAFDSLGNLYVANDENTIYRFTPGGVGTLFANTGLNGPAGLAFDSLGNLYAANYFSSTIERFTPGGVASVFATEAAASGPESLTFDSAGNLYVANYGTNPNIEKYTPGGVGSQFANPGSSVSDVKFDSKGTLYAIVRVGTGDIEKYSGTGTDLGLFTNLSANSPISLALDSANSVYVANYSNNTIEKYSSTGADLGAFASTGLNGPSYLAFAPAPEPSQFASLGLGLLGLGGLALKARKRTA